FIGYERQEIPIAGRSQINIQMHATATGLNQVVVIGYGTQSRKNLTSSITTVQPKELNKGAISDVGQLLQGKVAGLNITASGDPNKPAAVVLRGASTINSPQGPYYVIDGVPGADISLIAPDDIASIEVLKDAAATAIYGNKASNGVIIVTTKRGKEGQMRTTYNGYVGRETESSRLKLMNAEQIRNYITKNGSSFSPSDDLGANTNWMKAIERNAALSYNHNLSISGGSDKSTYSASLNYFSKEGILLKSELDRLIARLSVNQYALNNRLKFGLTVINSSSNSHNVPLQNVVLLQAAKHLPVSPVYNKDGSYFENFNTPGYFNPVSLINNAQDNTKYNSLLGSFTTEAKLPFGFTYDLDLSYQKTTSLHGEYYNSYYSNNYNSNFYNNPDPGIGIVRSLVTFGVNGNAYRSVYQNSSETVTSFLTWDRQLSQHHINLVIGYSWQDNINGDGFQASNTNFVSDYTGYQNLGLGNYNAVNGYTVDFGPDNFSETRFISDFARLNYDYKEKYLLMASVRRDGSSVFGKNNQWGYFPAVGIAWRISQENFMKNASSLSDLKLRLSYGLTGNALGFGAYTAQQLYSRQGTYYDNGVWATAIGVSQGSNPDLKWEVTATANAGVDFGFFDGKLNGSVDFYNKTTSDMIFHYTVSNTVVPGGVVWGNGGKIQNKGIEVSLSADPFTTKNFSWATSLNLASNKNTILNLNGPAKYGVSSDSIRYSDPEGPGQTNSTLQILKVGHPIGQFFSLVYEGKDANGNSQFLKHDKSLTTSPTIGTDYFYVGNPQPTLLLGWSNTLSYKNFELNFFIRGVFGNKIFNATRADLSYTVNANVNNLVVYASNDKMTDSKNNYYSSRYIENGSYVRLDNVTLSYRFDIKNKYISLLRIYTTANNLFVITKYSGIDPEITQGGVSLGVDYNNFYPKTRTVLLGVNVDF
ncbi:MAG: SusC/RagA family TonB-linked outer membrane protein, partial [Acidobacterium ailaaui]|nr:SusC/RagA family TonB-linked outer membrane protein [Pseudacidobacterium ailaaui]